MKLRKRLRVLRTGAVLTLCAGLAACATAVVRMRAGERANLQRTTIHAVHYQPTSFEAMTAGKALFGVIIGTVAAVKAGDKMVKQYQLPDPAAIAQGDMVDDLRSQLGLSIVPEGEALASDKPAALHEPPLTTWCWTSAR